MNNALELCCNTLPMTPIGSRESFGNLHSWSYCTASCLSKVWPSLDNEVHFQLEAAAAVLLPLRILPFLRLLLESGANSPLKDRLNTILDLPSSPR